MRILGLDMGEKRIGVAISDELGITAQGLDVLVRKGIDEDIKVLREIIERYKVEEIVVGLPVKMNGTMGDAADRVIEFVELLKDRCGISVRTWDERFTTSQVERLLIGADVRRRKRRDVIDKLAAQVMLQSYLYYIRGLKNKEG